MGGCNAYRCQKDADTVWKFVPENDSFVRLRQTLSEGKRNLVAFPVWPNSFPKCTTKN